MDDFHAFGSVIGNAVANERPQRILEINGGGSQYGYLLKAYQENCGVTNGVVDRIAMPESPLISGGAAYSRVLSGEYLSNPQLIDPYDFILILDNAGQIEPEQTRDLLNALQYKISRQILFLTALDSEAGYRRFHPVVFMGLDFSYFLVPGSDKAMQAYSVFPKLPYASMSIDRIPEPDTTEKMKIAFALPHHGLTGGMKALLQQIRHLKRIGHHVIAYFRSDGAQSAIPPWSDLTGDDFTEQFVIPSSGRFLDHIRDADIIILGYLNQAAEFLASKIPVALWEQGHEAMFGDFGKALHSSSIERLGLHGLYRLPIHLLTVSDVIASALKGIYNRDAFVYPNGVDTEFYHPGEKQNDTPVVLLTGHPSLAFKGFNFAFDVLQQAYAGGLRFRVKWAAQVNVQHGKINFPLEVVVQPSQHELAGMYRSADILFSTSLYESYSLPPLEAMASGTAVIAADNGGIRTYARHGDNCILFRQGDLSAAVSALAILINDPGERQRLARAGRETALEHSAATVIGALERRLFSIVRYDRQSRRNDPALPR